MALIAHWPLNGNTDDISGNGYDLVTNGGSFTDGKVGQSYLSDSSGEYLYVPAASNNFQDIFNNNFSISFWYYTNTGTEGTNRGILQYGASSGTDLKLHLLLRASGDYFAIGYYADDYNTGYVPTLGSWVHYTVIGDRNSSKQKLYINGQFYGERTTTGWLNTSNSNLYIAYYAGYYPNGKLNDLRLYDHALTDMEIQEIARAKILHYTFDDFQEPTTNINSDYTLGGWNNSGTATRNSNDTSVEKPFKQDEINIMSGEVIATGNQMVGIYSASVSPSTVYTMSIWYRQNRAGCGAPYVRTSVNNNSLGNLSYEGNSNSINWPVNQWIRITATVTTQADETGIYLSNYIGSVVGDKIWYYASQVEQKDHVTEYVYGSRTGQVNDYSGFFNHSNPLTETATPRWTADAKIGTGAYQFSSGRKILMTTINLGNGDKEWTATTWVKTTTTVNSLGTGSVFSNQSGGPVYSAMGVNNGKIVYWTYQNSTWSQKLGSTAVNDGNWHLLTWVNYNNYTMKMYVDGILDSNVANSTSGNNNPIDIVGASWNSSFDGLVDDPKIYMTALSDKDIKDLYEARAEIEESGVLYAKEIVNNIEPTVNLIDSIGSTVNCTKVGNGVVIDWTVSATDTYFFFNLINSMTLTTGEQYTLSFDCSGLPDGSDVRFNWANTGGLTSILKNGRNTLTFNVPADTRAFFDDSVRDASIDNLYLYNFQLEAKDHATPFTKDYRPSIPEIDETTFEYGANEIQETGIANFEDFSTVGITDGLVVYLNAEDNASYDTNKWKDLSGYNNHALLNGDANNPVWNGNSFYFPATALGLNSAMRIENSTSLSSISMMTVEIVFTLETKTLVSGDSDWMCLFSKSVGSTGQNPAISIHQSSGYRYLHIETPSAFNSAANTFTDYTGQTWYHVIATFGDGTSSGYLNSSQISTASLNMTANTNPIYIGTDFDTEMFKGKIKMIKIFNRALTEEEIKIEYNTMFNNEVQIHENGTLYAKDLKQY